MPVNEWMSLTDAATRAGVHRNTLGRWVSSKRLKCKASLDTKGRPAKLVNLPDVLKLIGNGVKPGRPAKAGK